LSDFHICSFCSILNKVTEQEDDGSEMLDKLGMKRTWESANHPYLFFNEDGMTLTPLGFFIEDKKRNIFFSNTYDSLK